MTKIRFSPIPRQKIAPSRTTPRPPAALREGIARTVPLAQERSVPASIEPSKGAYPKASLFPPFTAERFSRNHLAPTDTYFVILPVLACITDRVYEPSMLQQKSATLPG